MSLLLVSGLGRCGTSLTMQMLAATGYPIFEPQHSTWPDFELSKSLTGVTPTWPGAGATGALKWLDPQRTPPPKGSAAIFLTRNSFQQARSQLKMVRWLLPEQPASRSEVRRLACAVAKDEFKARVRLLRACSRVLELRFEDLVEKPVATFARVQEFLGRLDAEAHARAVACVRPRGSSCLPFMLEEELSREVSRG